MSMLEDDFTVVRPKLQTGSTDCKSPTRSTNASANGRVVFSDKGRSSAECSGTKGGRTLRTIDNRYRSVQSEDEEDLTC